MEFLLLLYDGDSHPQFSLPCTVGCKKIMPLMAVVHEKSLNRTSIFIIPSFYALWNNIQEHNYHCRRSIFHGNYAKPTNAKQICCPPFLSSKCLPSCQQIGTARTTLSTHKLYRGFPPSYSSLNTSILRNLPQPVSYHPTMDSLMFLYC